MVKNEEKYLDRCLASLKPIRDKVSSELIVVDTGSEDKTVEIAKKYTDKVYFEEWDNDFASMRNKSIKYARGEWLFILDGDEIVEKPEGIIKFLNSKFSKKFNSGMVNIKNIIREDDETAYTNAQLLRLFKNHKNFQYEGAIHEQPRFREPVIKIDSEIVHYGYLATDKDLMEYKFQRNTELLKKELEKDPENIYYWYQLSKSYGMYKDYEKSLEANLKAYEISKKNKIDLRNRMYVYTHLALAYYYNDRLTELEEICLEALEIKKGYLDLYFFLAEAQKFLKKYKEAIDNYKEYLRLLTTKSYIEDSAVPNVTMGKNEHAYLSLCELYRKQDNKEEALKYAKKITSGKLLKLAIPQIIKLSISLGKHEELYEYYHKELIDDKEELKGYFQNHLENELQSLTDEKTKSEIISLFCKEDDDYSLLNRVRLYLIQYKKIEDHEFEKIKNLDLTSLPVYFADVIYYYLKNHFVLGNILPNLRERNFQAYVQYLIKKYDNFSETVIEYLQNTQEEQSLPELRFKKLLEKFVLLLDKVDSEQFKYIWERYLEDGTLYITQVYNLKVIDAEMIYDVKDEEHAFLVYMVLARENRDKNEVEYVRYLRKALKVYPYMKKGIELLLDEIKNRESEPSKEQKEFEKLKEQVKANINVLIQAGQYGQAKAIVDEYLKMVPDDLEMLTLKSEVYLKLM